MAHKILIIEDAPQVSNILESKLTREGHEPKCVRTREQTLTSLDTGFDLILLSTDLPDDPWALLAELTARNLRVVMLLETDEKDQEGKARQKGACGIIIKPFKPTVVAKQVKELLETEKTTP